MLRVTEIAALREIKIAVRIHLQVMRELVVFLKRRDVVIEVLVEVRLAVVVQVVQARDLIAAEHIHFVLNDLQAERLEKSGGVTLPRHAVEFVVDVAEQPHVARHRANCRARAVRKKVDAAATNPGVEGIGFGHGERVHDVRLGRVRAEFAGNEQRFAPARRAAFRVCA